MDKTYGGDAHSLVAHSGAEAAQKTILVSLRKSRFFDTMFCGDGLDGFGIRTPCQEQFHHYFSRLFDSF
jgi:hypothetical protein